MRLKVAAIVTLLACLGSGAQAQAPYPNHTVKFLVAFAPGGIGDIVGRVVGQAMSEAWGRPVIIENRGGAGGNVGAGLAARADADGYTVLVTTSAFAVNLSLYDNPGYRLSDFQTAGVVANSPNILIAAPTLKQTTLVEVMAAAKAEHLFFGSAGIGTTPHLTGEQLFRLIGKLDVRHVPFTGAGPAVAATMAGHVPMSVIALPAAFEQVKAGLVKGLAIATPQRLPELPDVPTFKETGVADLQSSTMVAFFMPAKTPLVVLEKFNADLVAVVKSGALDRGLKAAGATGLALNQRDAQAYVEAEVATWGAVVRAAALKAE